ncbi:uncharacterized protein TNIN_94891 [Trichonephila inaurata madagascariensis]|uniref:PKD/REJ-like domain-containing protein n=1 Tax=Trichonephila inaurata madagascariensis TaxID=2747483 RepID=A0A8X7C2P8_9ARAC|nr:uncharacterized protein TNIN_94891 [Trichonephila inaurata madagascariensis]
MDCNRLLLLLIHIQVGLSQLSFKKMLDTQTELVQQNGFFQNVQVLGAKEFTDCESLGFRNATKNACGFCTGGNTKLSDRYFIDCTGKCNGNSSSVDCNGDCLGTAYVDQCSRECVGGNSRLKEKDVRIPRNCRGDCMGSSGDKLYTDNCGVCHSGTSPFHDCTNSCYLPSQEKQMAKLLCGRCVGGTTGILESEILDPCGNCRSDAEECPCNGTGKPDACGICNGGGTSCLRVSRFLPRALPVNTKAMVEIEGAFHGRARNIKCVFVLILDDQIHNKTEFFGSGNGTLVQCLVQLQVGMYRVGVRLEVGDPKEDFIEDSELFVYEQVGYTSMSPKQAVLDEWGPQELIATFTGSKVPGLPLICIISGDDWPEQKRLSPSEDNTLDTCIIPYPDSSVELSIAQSFNGIHTFKTAFSLKFYASPPNIKAAFIAEDGHAIVIVFDKPVNLSNLDECSKMLNSETLTRLGAGSVCKWAVKQQLIISVQNPIKRDPFRVTFQKDVLKQDGQRYALPKTSSLTIDAWLPRPFIRAQIAISGPTIVSYCGVFTLVGHFTSPVGGAEFYWAAYREDKNPLDPTLSNILFGIKSSSLSLNSYLLEVNTVYIFVLTAEQSSKEKYEAKHRISSVPYIGPLVTAYSDVVTQPSVTVDQKITLRADLTIPDCSTTDEHVHLMWSVNNPEVKFDFKSKSSYVYVIEPHSLPENSIVIFYANAYYGNRINVTYSQIELRVEPLKLKAAIKGTSKRVIGNKSGKLILESEKMKTGFSLTYHWRCSEQDGSVCYDYEENAIESLLIPKKIRNKPKLEIPCAKLKAGKILQFDLQVFNAKNSSPSVQSSPTVVFVEDKDIPQVWIEKILADVSNPVNPSHNKGYYIPAGLPVAVHATIISATSPLRSVKWDIKGSLVGHGVYMIGLSACDIKGACGSSNITIHADPGLSFCKVELKPYVEYKTVRIEIKGCSIPIGRQPVTYQLYLHSIESVFPFTAPQTSTIFNVVGPPQQMSNGTQISVQACDKYMLCTLFYGTTAVVTLTESREEDREKLMKKATLAIENRNIFPAISMLLTAASDPRSELSQNEIAHMLDAASKSTSNQYIDANQLSLIYSAMLPLLRRKEDNIKLKALDIIKKSTRLAFTHNEKIPSSVLSRGYSNSAEPLKLCNSDSEVAKKVKRVLEYFVEKISSTVPLGSKVVLSSKYPGNPSTLIFRQFLERTPMYIKVMSDTGLMEGSVRFEDAVREKVHNRKCKKKDTEYEGVVVVLTLYPSRAPFPANPKRTSPVIVVTLRKPEDGLPLNLFDVPNAFTISVTHINNFSEVENKKTIYKCSFWDEKLKKWSLEGIVTYGVVGNVMNCGSSHLTAFAVIETHHGLPTFVIVGIAIVVLIGTASVLMLIFLFCYKKQTVNP